MHILITVIIILLSVPINTIAQQWGLYTLYATKNGTQAYLIDTANSPVTYHTWTFPSTKKTVYSTYLTAGDTLIRSYKPTANTSWNTGPCHGGIQKVGWDGTVLWDWTYFSANSYCLHHDICPMPNGNVLMICYEVRSAAEATQAGSSTSAVFYSEKIIEVKQTGPTTGVIVWEWKLWEHLCQNVNAAKDNYVSSIVNNPQLMNINYLGTSNTNPQNSSAGLPDRWHMNGLDYNASLDQIAISMHYMNSVFVIDHSTTTAEAAGHTGGVSGKGGDFLYRWGNPASYGVTGTTVFNVVHDAHWVPSDNPLYPNYLAGYNNQGGTGGKTAVTIWNPPYSGNNYSLTTGQAYLPATYGYQYTTAFTATNEGNSQQLPNGNLLVNNFQGSIYEVNSAGTTLWTKTAAMSSHAYRFTKCFVRGPLVTASPSAYAVCLGNSVTLNSNAVSVTETSPTYTYAWSSGATTQNPVVTPTTNTVYTVTITNTAIGCSATATASVNVNSLPTANAGTDVSISSGSSATLTATGGGTYLWSIGGTTASITVSPTVTTTYTVTVTNANGCTAIDNVIVTVTGSTMSVNATSTPQQICEWSSVQLNSSVSGGSGPVTYSWTSTPVGFSSTLQNPSASPLVSTVYTVSVTDGTNNATSDISVTVNSLPAIPTVIQNQNILSSSAASLYQWYQYSVLMPGETNQNLNITADGLYQVEITDTNGCTAISAAIDYFYTGIKNTSVDNLVTIYPNPSTGIIILKGSILEKNNFEIEVFDLCGKLQFQTNSEKEIDLSLLQEGIYYITISSGETKINKKLTIIK
jgi:hypothetical protein